MAKSAVVAPKVEKNLALFQNILQSFANKYSTTSKRPAFPSISPSPPTTTCPSLPISHRSPSEPDLEPALASAPAPAPAPAPLLRVGTGIALQKKAQREFQELLSGVPAGLPNRPILIRYLQELGKDCKKLAMLRNLRGVIQEFLWRTEGTPSRLDLAAYIKFLAEKCSPSQANRKYLIVKRFLQVVYNGQPADLPAVQFEGLDENRRCEPNPALAIVDIKAIIATISADPFYPPCLGPLVGMLYIYKVPVPVALQLRWTCLQPSTEGEYVLAYPDDEGVRRVSLHSELAGIILKLKTWQHSNNDLIFDITVPQLRFFLLHLSQRLGKQLLVYEETPSPFLTTVRS